jgi:hypothetical protein
MSNLVTELKKSLHQKLLDTLSEYISTVVHKSKSAHHWLYIGYVVR